MNQYNIPSTKVMPEKCSICPFRCDASGNLIHLDAANQSFTKTRDEGTQVCEHPKLFGKESTHYCRGSRNSQLPFYFRSGVIDEPTDEGWNNRVKREKKERERKERQAEKDRKRKITNARWMQRISL